jgi:dipicolinate synthase subunit A
LRGNALFFCGTFCPNTRAETRCYTLSESFAVKNAVLTAEGALKIAIEETKSSVCGMRAAVLGFGRIGKILAKNLLALGARADVFARKSEARAWACAVGAEAHGFGELAERIGEYDCIFNTVPENIAGKEALARVKNGAPIIELASPPGGVSEKDARDAGARLVSASGLPGKTAPKSAGKIIYETITEMMNEEENT